MKCAKCGRPIRPNDDGLCCHCRIREELAQKAEVFRVKKRKCHDCGRPTADYRCEACWQKRRTRLGLPGVSSVEFEAAEEWLAY